jgi:hypothetical protein
MRAGQAFLAGALALSLCFGLAVRAEAKNPFSLGNAVLSETVDTVDGVPVDCSNFPAASDSYTWTASLTNINVDFKSEFTNDPVIFAFVSNSCSPLTAEKVTNTLEIPPGVATIKTNKTSGVVTITFSGALPDFNTINTNATPPLAFFDYITLELQYTPGTKTGTLQITGNANLCDALAAGPPQCLLFDVVDGFGCSCMTLPTQTTLDLTPLF